MGALLLLLATSSKPARAAAALSGPSAHDWRRTLLLKTMEHEGGYASVQRNLDGNGVSYGILQWTQRGGGLGELLSAMARADGERFRKHFGPRADALLDLVTSKSMAPLDGALLWDEPWLSRFRSAGRDPVFQDVQRQVAATGPYMTAAIEIARVLQLQTERAMVVFYNRTVHQGPGAALRVAHQLAAWWNGAVGRRPANGLEALAQYGWACAAPFRRDTAPSSASRSATTRWVEVSDEHDLTSTGELVRRTGLRVWHAFAGPWDLWDLIIKRTADILTDRDLSDVDVDLGRGLG